MKCHVDLHSSVLLLRMDVLALFPLEMQLRIAYSHLAVNEVYLELCAEFMLSI